MRSQPGQKWLLLIGALCLFAAPHADAAKDFSEPVEYAPLQVTEIEPEIVSLEILAKGLSVVYYLEYFERDLDAIPQNGSSSFIKKTGKPIFELNHQFGKEEVFDSGTNRGVAMRMMGYLVLKEKGVYQFQALSNDGVNVMLSGEMVISDPEQHSDRLSNIGSVTINKTGHYPLLVEYFQRKGTAALKLLWKVPGSEDFAPIPPNAYVHLP
ncbi:MAG: PA14 domain-containing protein [Desulfocapsaceae bacterium]